MSSQFILLRCDGTFGCDCPVIRKKRAEEKRRQLERVRKHRAKKKGLRES